MSLTRCLNLGLQALFLLVFALVMSQKMRGGPKVPKFTPGEHVVEVEDTATSSVTPQSATDKPAGSPGESTGDAIKADSAPPPGPEFILTDSSPIEPFTPYDAVPKAIAAQADPHHRPNTEDDWDRQLKKLENHCTVPKPKL
jgi:hypothetical protein